MLHLLNSYIFFWICIANNDVNYQISFPGLLTEFQSDSVTRSIQQNSMIFWIMWFTRLIVWRRSYSLASEILDGWDVLTTYTFLLKMFIRLWCIHSILKMLRKRYTSNALYQNQYYFEIGFIVHATDRTQTLTISNLRPIVV